MTKRKDITAKIRRVMNGDIPNPKVAEILGHFVQLCNGARGFAVMLFEEYHAAKPGSIMRSRLLAPILQALWKVNEKDEGPTDLGLLTDDDLEARANELAARMADAEEEEAGGAGPGSQSQVEGQVG